jgi:hypothetical protein
MMAAQGENMTTAQENTVKAMSNDEVNEYLSKLQSGKIALPSSASKIEHTVLNNMNIVSKRIRELNTTKNEIEKQIAEMSERLKGHENALRELSGEVGGYARLLLEAEEDRRGIGKPAQPDQAAAPAEAKPAMKPGPKPGIQPKHLKALKGGSNGKVVPTPVAVPATKEDAPGDDEPEGDTAAD